MAVKDVQQALRPAATALAAGNAGRPNAIAEEIKPQIVDYISDLEKRGAMRRLAQQRAAQQFGPKLRSVQRVWRERKRYAQQQPRTLREVIEILTGI